MSSNFSDLTLYTLIGKKIKIYLNTKIIIEGTLCGFDQFMNLVVKEPIFFYKKKRDENLGISLIRGSFISFLEEL
jgi:small nuclear ribonucleoprotein (snRNP)-like protein